MAIKQAGNLDTKFDNWLLVIFFVKTFWPLSSAAGKLPKSSHGRVYGVFSKTLQPENTALFIALGYKPAESLNAAALSVSSHLN